MLDAESGRVWQYDDLQCDLASLLIANKIELDLFNEQTERFKQSNALTISFNTIPGHDSGCLTTALDPEPILSIRLTVLNLSINKSRDDVYRLRC